MREQRWGAVVVRLDGDAHLHVWAPNQPDDPFDVDLTDHVAFTIDRGRGKAPGPEPHWTDRGGTTVIVDLDLGAEGSVTLDGESISTRAALHLAAAGFLDLLRSALEQTPPRRAAGAGSRSATASAEDEPDGTTPESEPTRTADPGSEGDDAAEDQRDEPDDSGPGSEPTRTAEPDPTDGAP